MFLSSEARRRAQVVEHAIADTADALQMPDVVEALGEDVVEARLDQLDGMFIPNFKDGTITIPRSYRRSDQIPIIASQVGEKIVAGAGLGFSPYQRERALDQMQGWRPIDLSDKEIHHLMHSIDPANHPAALGQRLFKAQTNHFGYTTGLSTESTFDRRRFTNLGNYEERLISGRPLVGIVMHPDNPNEAVHYPATMVHELQHVDQMLLKPIGPDHVSGKVVDKAFREELEAYASGAWVEWALYHGDDPRYAGNDAIFNDLNIENVRMDHAIETDPFAPRGVIRRALQEAGLDF